MTTLKEASPADLQAAVKRARDELDAHTHETVQWHFHPSTGCPFWLDYATRLKFDPLKEVRTFDDLKKFESFKDEWLRGGPVRRWVPKAFADKPIYVFETGGTTGIPKSRIAIEDFRTDYSLFSKTLPDEYFPPGANWLMLGPSGPRRLRLAVEHLAQFRGGICFCIDLDPRWVIKLIKKGWMEHLEAYKQHCIDQAITILERRPRHQVHVHHAQAARIAGHGSWKSAAPRSASKASPASSRGGTEFTPAVDPLCHRGISGRRLHDAHLRQHADGPGLQQAGRPPTRTTRSATTPRSRGPCSKSSTSTTSTASSTTARPAASS